MIDDPGNICVGNHVSFGEFAFIVGNGGLTIGNNVMVGHHVSIITAQHRFDSLDRPMSRQGLENGPITIHDDVWIGAGSRILCGVTIGRGTVIAANAVVTDTVPEFAIVGGIPGRVIGSRRGLAADVVSQPERA